MKTLRLLANCYFLVLCGLFAFSFPVQAAELKIGTDNPSIQVFAEPGQSLSLSVSGATGKITWLSSRISGSGSQVTYIAPDEEGLDIVTVYDSAQNTGIFKITVKLKTFSLGNATWEVFTNRDYVKHLAIAPDGKTIWVATEGGLEERNIETGEVKSVYMQADGLPSSTINALQIDKYGNLWVGTPNGLVRRTPQGRWDTITSENSNLPNNNITSLCVDYGSTYLWIGSLEGIASYSLKENSSEKSYSFDIKNYNLSPKQVSFISTNKSGRIRIVFWDGTLFYRDYGKTEWTEWKTTDGSSLTVTAFAVDDQTNNFWMARQAKDDKGETYYRLERWNSKDQKWDIKKTSNSRITCLYVDSKSGLWIGRSNKTLAYATLAYLSPDGNFEYFDQAKYVTAIKADSQGNVWIGTGDPNGYQSYGLKRRNTDGSWKSFDRTDLVSNYVYALADDNNGGIWIGTQRGLMQRTAKGVWKKFDLEPGYYELITSISRDKKGGLWVGTDAYGLYQCDQDGKVIQHINTKNSNLPTDYANLFTDGNGNLWVNTRNAGLAKLKDDGNFEIFNTANSPLPSNYDVKIRDDGKGGWWIGTAPEYERDAAGNLVKDASGNYIIHEAKGLIHRSANGDWGQVLNTSNSPLPSNAIYELRHDGKGGVWIATFKGLAHYKADGKWEIFNSKNSELPGDSVSRLLTDDNGGLWIGTSDYYSKNAKGELVYDKAGNPVILSQRGLAYLNSAGEWIVFDDKSGLPDSDGIKALLPDGKGGLWLGSYNGGLAHLSFGQKTAICQVQPDSAECAALLKGKRAAIIIAGGGNQKGDPIWDDTQAITSLIYEVFFNRGFDKSEIYYLSPQTWADFNGDGRNDAITHVSEEEGYLKAEDVKKAFEWAKRRGKLNQPLYVFFVDHGSTDAGGSLILGNSNKLTSSELKSIIDDYQNDVNKNQVVVFIDACYSGLFLNPLAAPDRAVITSTKADQTGRIQKGSFSYVFANSLARGADMRDAFDRAVIAQKNVSAEQIPQLDDNGNGIYESGVDGGWLKKIGAVNGDFVTADATLEIKSLSSSASLKAGESLTLKATATSSDKINQVWAVIRPPKIDTVFDSNGTPIGSYPRLNFSNTKESEWEGVWSDSVYNGEYKITLYAQDNSRHIAWSDTLTVTVSGGAEPPSKATVRVNMAKNVYHANDSLKVDVVENLGWGYDLYAVLILPGGQIFILTNKNEGSPISNDIKKWLPQSWQPRPQNSAMTVLDLTLPKDIPAGQYCIGAILSPESQPVLDEKISQQWVWDKKCFDFE